MFHFILPPNPRLHIQNVMGVASVGARMGNGHPRIVNFVDF